jgi:hypothetical protein
MYAYTALNPLRFVDPDGKVLVIEGSKEFKQKVNEQLQTLRATPTGRQIVTHLEKSKNVFTIKRDYGSSHAEPLDAAAAQGGKGSGGTIHHDPEWTPKVQTPKGEKETPSAVVLGHELFHAADYDKGTLDRSINPATENRRSEEKAVKVENKIRRQMGRPEEIPQRSGYD